jgi:hypothetical protein
VAIKKIVPYLDEFYQERHVPFERRIIIDIRGRLTIQGGILQAAEDHETQARNLREYQREMEAFKEFLKQKIFS